MFRALGCLMANLATLPTRTLVPLAATLGSLASLGSALPFALYGGAGTAAACPSVHLGRPSPCPWRAMRNLVTSGRILRSGGTISHPSFHLFRDVGILGLAADMLVHEILYSCVIFDSHLFNVALTSPTYAGVGFTTSPKSPTALPGVILEVQPLPSFDALDSSVDRHGLTSIVDDCAQDFAQLTECMVHVDLPSVEVPVLLVDFHGASLGFLDEIEHPSLRGPNGSLVPESPIAPAHRVSVKGDSPQMRSATM